MGRIALSLSVVGLSMALPYAIQASHGGAEPDDWPLPGWQHEAWSMAWLVGVTSFVLAMMALSQVGRRKGISALALCVAIAGGLVWAFPACINASVGL
jgi:hypothetical protein